MAKKKKPITVIEPEYEFAYAVAVLKSAHKHSFNNFDEVKASETCGCFYCLKIYSPDKIEEGTEDVHETDSEKTVFCPYCGTDTVLGSASGYPIGKIFLLDMHMQHFPDFIY